MFPSTVVKRVAAVALVAAVLASLLFLVHFYKEKAATAEERLQGVTNELTETRDAYDRYVNEQSLIRDILAAGAAAKQASKDKTDEAIRRHKAEGVRVTVSSADYDLLFNRSREVRESAAGSIQ